MSRLESIRPGGAIDGSLGRQPFPVLLLEVLRGHLNGRLELQLHPEARNFLVFREGVIVRVDLPDLGPTLISMLVEEGVLEESAGLELVRTADATATSESRLIEGRGLLEGGALREARARRARAQLVRLFDAGDVEFRFVEGQESFDPSEITLLETLPLIFDGLRRVSDDAVVTRHLPRDEARLRLAPSYPNGVDPFQFGPELSRSVRLAPTVRGLMTQGHGRRDAEAAVASLALAEMVEAVGRSVSGVRAEPNETSTERGRSSDETRAGDGLVVHRRSGARSAPTRPAPAKPSDDQGTEEDPGVSARSRRVSSASAARMAGLSFDPLEGDRRAVTRRLTPLEGKTYFQLLRVGRDTDAAQLERAYRFLLRRIQDEPEDAGTVALAGTLREAYGFLKDLQRAARYASADELERKAVEAEPKIDRAVRALGEARDAEAIYLITWAARLAPKRAELGALASAIEWLAEAPDHRRGSPRSVLAAEAQRTGDRRLKLLLAAVMAQESDYRGVKGLLQELGTADSPVIDRFVARGDR